VLFSGIHSVMPTELQRRAFAAQRRRTALARLLSVGPPAEAAGDSLDLRAQVQAQAERIAALEAALLSPRAPRISPAQVEQRRAAGRASARYRARDSEGRFL